MPTDRFRPLPGCPLCSASGSSLWSPPSHLSFMGRFSDARECGSVKLFQASVPPCATHTDFRMEKARVCQLILCLRKGKRDRGLTRKDSIINSFSLVKDNPRGFPWKICRLLGKSNCSPTPANSIRALDFRKHASPSTMLNAPRLPSSLGAEGFVKSAMP